MYEIEQMVRIIVQYASYVLILLRTRLDIIILLQFSVQIGNIHQHPNSEFVDSSALPVQSICYFHPSHTGISTI